MQSFEDHFPTYTVGEAAYDQIDRVCASYGKRAVIIGGHKALAAAEAAIRRCSLTITGTLYYGGEATYENVDALIARPESAEADMIFAVGGGKALDTAKCLAVKTGKPVFTFPTIASTCAAATSVSIMYHPDGRFREPFFFEHPPAHIFICPSILVSAPVRYLWAGMGDSIAKYLESEMSSRGEAVPDYIEAGVRYAKDAYETILDSGVRALAANRTGRVEEDFAETVKAVIVTVGKASILLCHDRVIDYNTGLAHAVYYAMTAYPHVEAEHLHGEVVAFGCLVLALVDQSDAFERLYNFNRWCDLPTNLDAFDLTPEMRAELSGRVLEMKDIEHGPYQITERMLETAFAKLDSSERNKKQ